MSHRIVFFVAVFLATASLRGATLPTIDVAGPVYSFNETDGHANILITRSGDLTGSSSVSYDGSMNGLSASGSVNFGPNESNKTVTMIIPNDDVYDDGKFNFFQLSNPVNAQLGIAGAFIRINDDEPIPQVSVSDVSVVEGNSGQTDAVIKVTLATPFKRSAAILAAVTGGTATLDSDYSTDYPGGYALYGTLPARATTFFVTVHIKGDTVPEPDETFNVSVSVNGTTLSDGFPGKKTGTVTILNDDTILTPASQRVARGTSGSAFVGSSVPSATTDRIQLSSSNPSIATVPPFVDIQAGSAGQSFDITALAPGTATITATPPPSRGAAMSIKIDVYEVAFLTFERPGFNLAMGANATAVAHVDPPPAAPVDLVVTQSNPSVASLPAVLTVGPNGIGTLSVHATGIGTTSVLATLPQNYGGSAVGFRVDVSAAGTLALTRVDAVTGSARGGERVSIYGDHVFGRCVATFDGVSGLNTSEASAAGIVTTTAPPHDAGMVDVALRCGDSAAVLPNAYRYMPAPAHLAAITPASGSMNGGTLIKASGDTFRRGRCTLWFGGVTATTLQSDQTTEMLVAAPAHLPGTVDVTLRCGGDVSTLANAFTFTGEEPAATIIAVTPATGAPGDRIIIGGSRFRDSDSIFFDNAAAVDVSTDVSSHLVTVPDVSAGNLTITLIDAAGRTITGPVFKVLAPPIPHILTAPTQVLASSEFRITGTGLRRSLTFFAGDTQLLPIIVAPTYAQLRLPPSVAPGTTTLTVSNIYSHSLEVRSTGVAVTSVSPQCALTEGGALVTITGNGFAEDAVVSFGGADSVDVQVRDEHTIVARVPPSSGFAIETITVTNPNGDSGQLSNGFHYNWPDTGCSESRRRGARH